MNTIYYILAGLAVVYILMSMNNKRISKKRKSRKFMEGYKRRGSEKEPNTGEKN